MATAGVILALDVASFEEARRLAFAARDSVGMLKVGLELFVAEGPRVLALAGEVERPIFLDLKLHDIPETVDRAVARACALGVHMLTVHAAGGAAMVSRAVARAHKEGSGLQIAAVTVLTSLDADDLSEVGVAGGVSEQVERLARLAHAEGAPAFVCSPHEAANLRRSLGPKAVLITPGVRSSVAGARDDQKRVLTATEAVRAGSHWVVVGRPIRDAADPAKAARAIAEEVQAAARSTG